MWDRTQCAASAGERASRGHRSAWSGTCQFKSDGKLLDRFVLNVVVINLLGAWGDCLTQCLHTKYFRARRRCCLLLSVFVVDGRRGGDTLKSKCGDASYSIFTHPYLFWVRGRVFQINSLLMQWSPSQLPVHWHLSIFEENLSRI
jgi:hypothetical protein